MSSQRMDADTAEALAAVVRLLRRAAELVWAAVDVEGVGSPRQALGLGIDVAANEARNLLPDAISIEGPVPFAAQPSDLLHSAEQLLQRIAIPGVWAATAALRARVAHLVLEANASVDG
jgi:hypothetical protein